MNILGASSPHLPSRFNYSFTQIFSLKNRILSLLFSLCFLPRHIKRLRIHYSNKNFLCVFKDRFDIEHFGLLFLLLLLLAFLMWDIVPDFRLDWLVWLDSNRSVKHTQKGPILGVSNWKSFSVGYPVGTLTNLKSLELDKTTSTLSR